MQSIANAVAEWPGVQRLPKGTHTHAHTDNSIETAPCLSQGLVQIESEEKIRRKKTEFRSAHTVDLQLCKKQRKFTKL